MRKNDRKERICRLQWTLILIKYFYGLSLISWLLFFILVLTEKYFIFVNYLIFFWKMGKRWYWICQQQFLSCMVHLSDAKRTTLLAGNRSLHKFVPKQVANWNKPFRCQRSELQTAVELIIKYFCIYLFHQEPQEKDLLKKLHFSKCNV